MLFMKMSSFVVNPKIETRYKCRVYETKKRRPKRLFNIIKKLSTKGVYIMLGNHNINFIND